MGARSLVNHVPRGHHYGQVARSRTARQRRFRSRSTLKSQLHSEMLERHSAVILRQQISSRGALPTRLNEKTSACWRRFATPGYSRQVGLSQKLASNPLELSCKTNFLTRLNMVKIQSVHQSELVWLQERVPTEFSLPIAVLRVLTSFPTLI